MLIPRVLLLDRRKFIFMESCSIEWHAFVALYLQYKSGVD